MGAGWIRPGASCPRCEGGASRKPVPSARSAPDRRSPPWPRSSRLAMVKPKTTRGRPPVRPHEAAASPFDERRLAQPGPAPTNVSATAAAPRTSRVGAHRLHRGGVGPEHDVRVEHREQRVEVAAARGGEEGVDDLRAGGLRSGSPRRPAPCTRRRARLASCRAAVGERPTIGAISSNGTANMSCSTNASRSAGASVSSTTSSARPTESASSASCSGSTPLVAARDRLGRVRARAAPRAATLRERSMSRHTRATTVVSQPPRFSTPLVSARLSRSQASCTASSASLSEPSIR